LQYYRLCVFASRTRRVKGKGRKNRQCSVARALCEKNYNNENTPGKTGFDNAMMYLATRGLTDENKTMKRRRRRKKRRKRRKKSDARQSAGRAQRGDVARIARRQACIENELYKIWYHKHRVRQGTIFLYLYPSLRFWLNVYLLSFHVVTESLQCKTFSCCNGKSDCGCGNDSNVQYQRQSTKRIPAIKSARPRHRRVLSWLRKRVKWCIDTDQSEIYVVRYWCINLYTYIWQFIWAYRFTITANSWSYWFAIPADKSKWDGCGKILLLRAQTITFVFHKHKHFSFCYVILMYILSQPTFESTDSPPTFFDPTDLPSQTTNQKEMDVVRCIL